MSIVSTDEVRYNYSSNTFKFYPIEDLEQYDNALAGFKVSFYDPNGDLIGSLLRDMMWNNTSGLASINLDTTDTDAWFLSDPRYDYKTFFKAAISVPNISGSPKWERWFSVVLNEWEPQVTTDDIISDSPRTNYLKPENLDYKRAIRTAEERIRREIISRGWTAGMVQDKGRLDQYLKYRSIENVWLSMQGGEGSETFSIWQTWQTKADTIGNEIMSTLVFDENQDGIIDNESKDMAKCGLFP